MSSFQIKLWELSQELWEHRNSIRHPNNKDDIHHFKKEAVDFELKKIQERYTELTSQLQLSL